MRLDLYVAQQAGISRTRAKVLIEAGQVNLLRNGAGIEVKPQLVVREGDQVQIDNSMVASNSPELILSQGALDIIYEDERILIINKPVGLVVHPAAGHSSDTLANIVKFYLHSINQDFFPADKIGLVHRLDAATSGVLVIAKTPEALDYISSQFADREVQKYYLAVVQGRFPPELSVDKPIGRDKYNRQRQSSRASNSRLRSALTSFVRLSMGAGYSMVLAMPHTGRTHQIRVHLSESGFPIVGDDFYGGQHSTRLMLHAWCIVLGLDEKLTQFVAPIPTDFEEYMDKTGLTVGILNHALEERTGTRISV